MERFALLILAAFLAACTSTNEAMESWLGSASSEVMASWGAPDLSATAPNGKQILTWHGRNAAGEIICRQTFTVSKADKIEAFSHNCLF